MKSNVKASITVQFWLPFLNVWLVYNKVIKFMNKKMQLAELSIDSGKKILKKY